MKKPPSPKPSKTAPALLADHLNETYRLTRLFDQRSNLGKLIVDAVKDGTLYTPPPFSIIRGCSVNKLDLCNGSVDPYYSFDISVSLESTDPERTEEETYRHATTHVSLPVSLVGLYTIETTYPYTANPTCPVETMVFDYKPAAMRKWLKDKGNELIERRLMDARKARAKLDAEIGVLSKKLAANPRA